MDAQLQTVFIAPTTGTPYEDAHYLNVESTRSLSLVRRRLTELVGDGYFDLVIAHRYRSIVAVARSRLNYGRMVGVAHEFGLLRSTTRKLTRKWLAPKAVLAGVSEAVTAELSEPRCCLPNPVDVDALAESALDRDAARTRLGIDRAGYVVGVVGRLHYKKQPALALDAFAQFEASHPAELVFLGDGELRGELEARAQSGSVRFLGHVPNAHTLMRAFDCLLVCSSNAEAFGMVVVEAAALGVPVVSTPAPGPKEILGPVPGCARSATAGDLANMLRAVRDRPVSGDQLRERVRSCYGLRAHGERIKALIAGG